MPHIVVGTAGHIDHGKTALVKALTGIDADRLKEEKARGITIDLGFANLLLESGATVSFIDVPGHERFIKNMLAGVGGIDAVMLVIAVDEAVKPQTREHLDICSLLHIRHGVTVLTKVDKSTSERANVVEAEVREFLKGSFLEEAAIVRVSSSSGTGLPQLVQELSGLAAQARPRDVNGAFRLPVDRSFTMKGFGTVVTGTLLAGRVQKDDEVEILPAQRRTRVRGAQIHGMRTALNLHGVDVSDVKRGMVVAAPGALQPTSMIDCEVQLLPGAPGAIVMRKRIRFHIGTAELMGYVVLLGCDRLDVGQAAFAQIRLEAPTVAVSGDRFIIRQYSPMVTIGGGEILDVSPRKHRRMDSLVLERLNAIKRRSAADRMKMFIEETKVRFVDSIPPAGLSADEITMRSVIEARFRDYGLMPPPPNRIVDELNLDRTVGRKLVRLLTQGGILVNVGSELVVYRDSLASLIRDVRGLKAHNPRLGVGEFKELTGVSRKYAIPLLEYLDRQRVTRRIGDDRTIT